RRQRADRLDRDVLELVRDDVGAGSQPSERGWVVERADDELPHLAGGRVRRRIEEAEAEPERQAGEPEHAAELTPADARDECHGERLTPGVSRRWIGRV